MLRTSQVSYSIITNDIIASHCTADVQLLAPHVPFMIAFIAFVGNDDDHTESNIAVAAGLLG